MSEIDYQDKINKMVIDTKKNINIDDIKKYIERNDGYDGYSILYYHFLDGLLDSSITDTKDNIKSKIVDFNLIKDNEIHILDEIDTNGILNFENISNKARERVNFNLEDISKELNDKEKTDAILSKFKYCIYRIFQNSHATTNLIMIVNNKMYFVAFNSGDGIEINDY